MQTSLKSISIVKTKVKTISRDRRYGPNCIRMDAMLSRTAVVTAMDIKSRRQMSNIWPSIVELSYNSL